MTKSSSNTKSQLRLLPFLSLSFLFSDQTIESFMVPSNTLGKRLITTTVTTFKHNPTELFFNERDADMMEMFVGGQRYEMVELPDSLVDTTLFVGNLCEFVTDDMLSSLFQQASKLSFVPACVVRKPNMTSLKYGFVTFPSIEEKEAAIIRFTGYLLNERPMKVEAIKDDPNRVRVPEKLVAYTVGKAKPTRDGNRNTLRMAQNVRKKKNAHPPKHEVNLDFHVIASSKTNTNRGSNSSSRRKRDKTSLTSSFINVSSRVDHSSKRQRKSNNKNIQTDFLFET